MREGDPIFSEAGSIAQLADLLPRRRHVAVIGIDDYARLPKLRCAVSDALGVQDLLVKRFGFEAPIPPLINQAATRQAIEALIDDDLRRIVEPKDALILFFAGHGTTRVARLPHALVETGYIIPVEARRVDQFSDLINMEDLLRRCGLIPVDHILVILDACHSGVALGPTVSHYRGSGSYIHNAAGSCSRRVITSARRDELALDSGPIPGHSLFTGTLIRALTSGEADIDGNGIITSSELALFVQQRVAQASGSRQTPDFGSFYLDNQGEMVFAGRGSRADAGGTPSDIEPDTVIADRYRIIEHLRWEYAGDAFSAIDLRGGAHVALKLIRAADRSQATTWAARLEREGRAMSSIYSYHVPRVLEITADRERGRVIVMEPRDGDALIDRLKRAGPIPFAQLHPLIEQVWLALTDIHRAGITHASLKTSNVFLDYADGGDARVKLLDFGICRIPGPDNPNIDDALARIPGLLTFMPPEQIGKSRRIDRRADIYACSALIFQSLSGHIPWAGRNVIEMVDAKFKTDARLLSDVMAAPVEPALEAFIARGLERDPAKRFQTSEEALTAWQNLAP